MPLPFDSQNLPINHTSWHSDANVAPDLHSSLSATPTAKGKVDMRKRAK